MSTIRDYVMYHSLFCHHDHHISYAQFDAGRDTYSYESLLNFYTTADLVTAEGPRPPTGPLNRERIAKLWSKVRATGYGRAVTLGCRELFGLEYAPENFDAITEALQNTIAGKSAAEVYHYFVRERAQNVWTIHDYIDDEIDYLPKSSALNPHLYPDTYRFSLRLDYLLGIVDAAPVEALERFTGRSINTLEQLVERTNEVIDRFQATGKLASIKVAVAYVRDLCFGDPTYHEAELAFNRIRSRKLPWGSVRQDKGAVDAAAGRALGDFMFHCIIQRAHDDDLPVQIHTGYLEGNWRPLAGTQAIHLLPIFDKYRRVRFDVFHASWPWTAEMGAIAKNYPNVWANLCWAWAMNPGEAARTLSAWLDCIPFNKIFAYGADNWLPWGNVGYSLQAKLGIARVLEEKIAEGDLSEGTAREVASAIMLDNGEEFYSLGPQRLS